VTALGSGCQGAAAKLPAQTWSIPSPASRPSSLDQGRALFYRVVNGETELVQLCRDHWMRMHDHNPRDPLVAAYLGATVAFSASVERWPPRKGQLAKQGLELLENAVSLAPENVEVRFLRGTTSQRLPALMGRRAVAKQDLAYAASAAPAAVASGELGLDIAAASLFHYGMLCDAEGNRHEAQEAWRAASNLGPDTPAGRRAQRMIPARKSPR
jgi:hypothetical protein